MLMSKDENEQLEETSANAHYFSILPSAEISAFVKIQQHYLQTMLINYNNGQVVCI